MDNSCYHDNSISSPTTKTLSARGVRTSNSMRPQTTVHTVGDRIHQPATLSLPDCNETLKALELWKAKPDLRWISQTGQLTKAVGAVACSTTTKLSSNGIQICTAFLQHIKIIPNNCGWLIHSNSCCSRTLKEYPVIQIGNILNN